MARLKKKDFKKSSRFQGLKKKIKELTILCDVQAFLFVFEDPSQSANSYSWPEDRHTFLSLIHKYEESKLNSLQQVKNETIKINNKIHINIDAPASSSNSEVQEILHKIYQKQKVVDDRIQFLGLNKQDLNEENGKKTEMKMVMGCDRSCGLLNCVLVESRALCSRKVEESGDNNEKGKEVEGDFLGFSDQMKMGNWMDDDFGFQDDEFLDVDYDNQGFTGSGISPNELGFDGFFSAGWMDCVKKPGSEY